MAKLKSTQVSKFNRKSKEIKRNGKKNLSRKKLSSKGISKKQDKPIGETLLEEFSDTDSVDNHESEDDLHETCNNEISEESLENLVEDEAIRHKKDLLRLKQSDPEFYKFLQENDKKLLEFNLSDNEDLGNIERERIHRPIDNLELASDESDYDVSHYIYTGK